MKGRVEMAKKEDVTYLLKHNSGFFVKSTAGHTELTSDINRAKRFPVNEIRNSDAWEELYSTGDYTTIKRTEILNIDYEEVPIDE